MRKEWKLLAVLAVVASALLVLVAVKLFEAPSTRGASSTSVDVERETGMRAESSWARIQRGAHFRRGDGPGMRLSPYRAGSEDGSGPQRRAWSPSSVDIRPAKSGEEAPVRGYSLDSYDPKSPGPPPNPFVAPKQHLTPAETRAGLSDPPPAATR